MKELADVALKGADILKRIGDLSDDIFDLAHDVGYDESEYSHFSSEHVGYVGGLFMGARTEVRRVMVWAENEVSKSEDLL